MRTAWRNLSRGLTAAAFLAMLCLLSADALHQLQPTDLHRRAGAWSFVLIGAANIALQFGVRRFRKTQFKQALLGLGFVLWGCAQLVTPGPLVVMMDCAVTMIFVIDLGSLIWIELARLHGSPRYER